MKRFLDKIRFQPEMMLIDDLYERFGLESILKHQEEGGELLANYEFVLSTQLRITGIMAPRLYSLFKEVRELLDFGNSTDLFVFADSSVNAFSMASPGEGKPNIVTLTSGMVERMDDDELRFAIGHELGHLYFRHNRPQLLESAFGEDGESKQSRMPPYLKRRLETWRRLAEISADRAGFVATSQNLETVVSAFFKTSYGLGPEHLSFDMDSFFKQLSELKTMKRRELLALFSHPVTPVRVKALQLFGEGFERKGFRSGLHRVDEQVSKLSQLMEHEVTEPLEVHARDFLRAGGLLIGHAGGAAMNDEQMNILIHLLLPFAGDPESEIQRVKDRALAEEQLSGSISWLKENAGEERFFLFRQLTHIVAVNGVPSDDERALLVAVANELGIPERSAEDILFEVLAEYLQSRALSKAQPNPVSSFMRESA